jgi:hypothetical protein
MLRASASSRSPKASAGAQRERHLVAHGLALQRRLDLGEQVVVAAVQVGGGAGVQRLALEVGHACRRA